jgi:hypothetical protein
MGGHAHHSGAASLDRLCYVVPLKHSPDHLTNLMSTSRMFTYAYLSFTSDQLRLGSHTHINPESAGISWPAGERREKALRGPTCAALCTCRARNSGFRFVESGVNRALICEEAHVTSVTHVPTDNPGFRFIESGVNRPCVGEQMDMIAQAPYSKCTAGHILMTLHLMIV